MTNQRMASASRSRILRRFLVTAATVLISSSSQAESLDDGLQRCTGLQHEAPIISQQKALEVAHCFLDLTPYRVEDLMQQSEAIHSNNGVALQYADSWFRYAGQLGQAEIAARLNQVDGLITAIHPLAGTAQ